MGIGKTFVKGARETRTPVRACTYRNTTSARVTLKKSSRPQEAELSNGQYAGHLPKHLRKESGTASPGPSDEEDPLALSHPPPPFGTGTSSRRETTGVSCPDQLRTYPRSQTEGCGLS